MAKKPKRKQTEWNKQGKAIADTAVPYYQQNLTRMDNYLRNPSAAIDNYLNKYYDNTVEQSDFIRNYNRAMGGATAQNYAATGGGYDTSNQRRYDDQQRYMNDWAARLRDKGIATSAEMAYKDYANMLYGNQAYQNAYALGKNYSDVDDYNYQAKQYNRFGNQLMGLVGGTGQILSAIPTPITQGIGAGMQAIGNTFGLEDTSGLNPNYYNSIAKGIAQTSQYGGDNWITGLTAGRDISSGNQSLRGGDSINSASQGQYLNPTQVTSNYLNGRTNANNLANVLDPNFLKAMRAQGINI